MIGADDVTMQAKPRGLPRAPIGLQLVLLIAGCLLATHLLLFAIVVLLPPPQPPIYRMSEIADALRGGSLEARLGRPMLRSVQETLPEDLARPGRRGRPGALGLAAALDVPPSEVRLGRRPPSRLARWLQGPQPDVRIELRALHAPPRLPGEDPFPGAGRLGLGPPHLLRDMPVVGEFQAALRRPDGRWTVVSASPEPFPSAWQLRALLLLGGGALLVAPAGLLFARRITAPLHQFREAAERLGRDPHAAPAPVRGPAEVAAAALAVNDMQRRLRRYIDDRTAMVGAISHDLRTPLARIRFKLEAAPADLRATVLSDVAQMEQMIQGVLTFIRDESTPRSRERLDLLSLLECVVDDAALVGGDVEIVAADAATVEGDPVALQRLFANLVDNALKYGRSARVRITRLGAASEACVEIEDAGLGLAGGELERAFDPFYRGDTARNVDAGGIGLGLPIARATARAHGGDVQLLPSAQGLVARVTLPLAATRE